MKKAALDGSGLPFTKGGLGKAGVHVYGLRSNDV